MMANSISMTEIESAIRQLSVQDRLWLIERLVHSVRADAGPAMAAELAEMAADPQVQRELAEINQEVDLLPASRVCKGS
jgi:hypothetical protein